MACGWSGGVVDESDIVSVDAQWLIGVTHRGYTRRMVVQARLRG